MTDCSLSPAYPATSSKPSVSIVIPTHRDRGYIRATVDSAVKQLEHGDEIILVANGCEDSYHEYLQHEFAGEAQVMRIAVGGVASARNAGASIAQGDALIFLDDDDELTPTAVSTYKALLAENALAAAVVGDVIGFGERHENPSARYPTGGTRIELAQVLVEGPPAPSPGAGIVRKVAFNAIGGLRQTNAPADDWEMWLRLSEQFALFGIDTPTLRYRYHDSRASLEVSRMARSGLQVLKQFSRRLRAPDADTVRAVAAMHFCASYYPKQRQAFIENCRRGRVRAAVLDLHVAFQIRLHEFEMRLIRQWRLRVPRSR
jgi:glycosyltransferase involved in cell wall biosynthesis